MASHTTATSFGDDAGFHNVNPHCLGHIVELAKTRQIVCADDIHDEHGNKLLARGYAVSPELQEKLLRRKLKQPLESSLTVSGGATMENIVADALAKIEEDAVLTAFSGSSLARGLLRDMRQFPLTGPLKLLLTSARENRQASYAHGLAAMIVSAGMAASLELGEPDASNLILAAMVHDVGEMYINPEYLNSTQSLPPSAWKHVASHPCVGYAFIREFTTFPSAVAVCILHHHERLNGSGYPFRRRAEALDRLSILLAVADVVSALVLRGGKGLRRKIEVALSIVPEEFDRGAVSSINYALRGIADESCNESPCNCRKRLLPVLRQLGDVRTTAEAILAADRSGPVGSAVDYALSILGHIEKSLRATGVSDLSQLELMDQDRQVMGEICLIIPEIVWRMRNLARNLHMQVETSGSVDDLARTAELVALLDTGSPPVA